MRYLASAAKQMGPILEQLNLAGNNTLPRHGRTAGHPCPPTHTHLCHQPLLGSQGPPWAVCWAAQGGHGNGKEDREGKWVPQRLGCSLQLGAVPHCLRASSPCKAGREAGPGMLGPYPVTLETPTSLSWKQDWARLLIDSCWVQR